MAPADKEIVLRLIDEVVNNEDLDALEELVHPDFFSHEAIATRASGPSGLRRAVEDLHEAFAGFRIDPKDVIAAEGKVVVRATASGRHVGRHNGVAPTGRDWSAEEIHIFRIADGRIVEYWASRGDTVQPTVGKEIR